MNRAIIILVCSAVLLAGANVWVRLRADQSPEARTARVAAGEEANLVSARKEAPDVPAETVPPLKWDNMESADYQAYIENLRHVGFPEELIREIIIADVNKMYAQREDPLKIPPVPHDAPLEVRRRKPTVEDVENLFKLRAIQMEKHELLEELLGVKVPREIIRTPNSRNYEAAEFAVRQLPAEKQQAALEIYEKEILLDDLNQARGLRGKEELAAYRTVNEERDAALKELLTPDEFDQFIMNATPPGSEMQRRVMGMEASDEEMLAMWKVAHEHWKEQGGTFGRWRAERVPEEQLRAADEKLEQNMAAALGSDRYLDYQLATSGTGQQLRNFGARYGLERDAISNAFHLQKEIDRLQSAGQIKTRYGLPDSALPAESRGGRLVEAQKEMEQTMGSDLYRSWNEGRNLKYDFQP